MSSKKITELASYSALELSASNGQDLFFVTDVANQETKKITGAEITKYVTLTGNTYTGSFTGSFTGSLLGTASYAITASYAHNSPAIGEANTASNTGSAGYGLFKEKVGVDLRFKKIQQGTNVNITDDTTSNTLIINVPNTNTSPGNSVGTVQYHGAGGVFAGNNNFKWDNVNNNLLTIVGKVKATTFESTTINAVGYIGTSSFAVSASRALSSSYAISSSYGLSGSYAVSASYSSRQDLGINSQVSPNPIASYKGSNYNFSHGLGGTPKYWKAVLLCITDDTTAGYSQYVTNDEIDATAVWREDNDNEMTAITTWANTTLLGASFFNTSYEVNNKNTGGISDIDPTKWKIKFYYA